MKYVMNSDGSIKVTDGKPTVIDDTGKEFGIDAIGAQSTITNLNKEAAEYRKKASERGKLLEQFANIDPEVARTALSTVASLGDNHKLEVETLKASLNKTWQEKVDALSTEKETLTKDLYKATVTAKFATSEVVKKTVLTPDIAAKVFGDHFSIDGTAKDSKGNVIYSREKPGEAASFDEALEFIINSYPSKESILRGTGADGSGAGGGSGSNNTATAARFFDKKSPHFNLTEQTVIANKNPELYKQLKAQFS